MFGIIATNIWPNFLLILPKIKSMNLNKDVLFDSVEQEYLFYYSNLVVNGCFLIAKPHKYHILPKRNRAVYVPELINIFITLQKLVSLLYKTLIF